MRQYQEAVAGKNASKPRSRCRQNASKPRSRCRQNVSKPRSRCRQKCIETKKPLPTKRINTLKALHAKRTNNLRLLRGIRRFIRRCWGAVGTKRPYFGRLVPLRATCSGSVPSLKLRIPRSIHILQSVLPAT